MTDRGLRKAAIKYKGECIHGYSRMLACSANNRKSCSLKKRKAAKRDDSDADKLFVYIDDDKRLI